MRRIWTETLREAFWILAVLAHASIIATVWNTISLCGGGMGAMAPWEPVGAVLLIGMLDSRPAARTGKAVAIRIALSFLYLGIIVSLECLTMLAVR